MFLHSFQLKQRGVILHVCIWAIDRFDWEWEWENVETACNLGQGWRLILSWKSGKKPRKLNVKCSCSVCCFLCLLSPNLTVYLTVCVFPCRIVCLTKTHEPLGVNHTFTFLESCPLSQKECYPSYMIYLITITFPCLTSVFACYKNVYQTQCYLDIANVLNSKHV